MNRMCVLIATGLLWLGDAATAGEEGLFPFVVSYDSPANATNVSAWLDGPAGGHGFVKARDGQLANDAGPVRFWATNIAFEGCFPTHQQAERLAARLARLGINCVRMHHMDMFSIWGNSPNKLTIDPKKMERLDFFIAELKKHGVYTNLNLHVSRWFGEEEGFSGRSQRPEFDKGLDNFEPRMIELQKKYARDLLTHVNPYTGNPYTREPAVAFVEINNENALHATWGEGKLDQLPEPYASTYRKLWNGWLERKYGSTEQLRKAWNSGTVAPGAELLRNGHFGSAPEGTWNLERDDDAQAQWSIQAEGPQGRHYLRIVVNRRGVCRLASSVQPGRVPSPQGSAIHLELPDESRNKAAHRAQRHAGPRPVEPAWLLCPGSARPRMEVVPVHVHRQ